MDVVLHDDAGWREAELEDARATLDADRADVVWVRVPDADDVADAAAALGVDATLASAGPDPRAHPGRPHVAPLTGDGWYVALPSVGYREETSDVLPGRIVAVFQGRIAVTAEDGASDLLSEVMPRLRRGATRAPSPAHGARAVLYVIAAAIVSRSQDIELALGEDVAAIEQVVFSASPGDPVAAIYALKREIAEARQALVPLGAIVPQLAEDLDDRAGDGSTTTAFHRLGGIADRMDRRLADHDALLGDMLAAHLTMVSVRQNDDVRRISAWAGIVAAPTLVASVYGMNFEHMPELSWTFGYPLALGTMAAICVGLYVAFRRSGWL